MQKKEKDKIRNDEQSDRENNTMYYVYGIGIVGISFVSLVVYNIYKKCCRCFKNVTVYQKKKSCFCNFSFLPRLRRKMF